MEARSLPSARAVARLARVREEVQRATRQLGYLKSLPDREQWYIAAIARQLDSAIESTTIPSDLTLYRGLRNLEKTFGVADLDVLVGREHQMSGYLAATVFEESGYAKPRAHDPNAGTLGATGASRPRIADL